MQHTGEELRNFTTHEMNGIYQMFANWDCFFKEFSLSLHHRSSKLKLRGENEMAFSLKASGLTIEDAWSLSTLGSKETYVLHTVIRSCNFLALYVGFSKIVKKVSELTLYCIRRQFCARWRLAGSSPSYRVIITRISEEWPYFSHLCFTPSMAIRLVCALKSHSVIRSQHVEK